jgi:hypothetical protein
MGHVRVKSRDGLLGFAHLIFLPKAWNLSIMASREGGCGMRDYSVIYKVSQDMLNWVNRRVVIS